MKQIKCINCNESISLDLVMQRHAEELLNSRTREVEAELSKEKKKIERSFEKLEDEKKNQDKIIKDKLDSEREILMKDVANSVNDSWKVRIRFLETQLKQSEERISIAVDKELTALKKASAAEQKEKETDLIIERAISDRSKSIKDQISKQYAEDYHRKDSERESQVAELRKQIIELKQKAEQGSQQIQGEVLELEIENGLKSMFPKDHIEPVAKGVNGADLIQTVIGNAGQRYGKIIIETKRTKNYSPTWLSKLKEDRNISKCDIAVLISEAMPSEGAQIVEKDGIWIVTPEFSFSAIALLRSLLKEVSQSLAVSSNRVEKAEVVYNYLVSQTFRQRLETIVESFVNMRDDLEKEKRAIQRNWKLRENQLERIFQASLGMYSDIQMLVGQPSFQIKALEYPGSLVANDE